MNHPEPKLRSVRDWLWFLFCGFFMGASDVVPGVSGGTIAFILGFYEPLIENIRNISGRKPVSWSFLAALGLGISSAILSLSHLIQYLLSDEIYRVLLYSLFIGLILGSIFFCFRQIGRIRGAQLLSLFTGLLAAFFLTGLPVHQSLDEGYQIRMPLEVARNADNYDQEKQLLRGLSQRTLSAISARGLYYDEAEVYDAQGKYVGLLGEVAEEEGSFQVDLFMIGCGVVAVSAMLLPGVSGSYMMVILGVYPLIIGAIADSLQGDLHAMLLLANMGVGILLGALLFSRAVSWLFHHYHAITVALLTGFMFGALRSLWPFWSYSYLFDPLKLEKGPLLHPLEPILPSIHDPILYGSLGFAVAGFLLILFLESRVSPKDSADG